MTQLYRIIIRADASLEIGSGHVMRCLTLADELQRCRADVMFVCREHPGHLIDLIESKGYPVVRLRQAEVEYIVSPEDIAHAAWLGVSWQQDALDTIDALSNMQPQWLIVDHYALDLRWEKELRPHVGRIMVIDDIADRPHDCDLLLDQNLYADMKNRYNSLVSDHCIRLLGPTFVLLRSEFTASLRDMRSRDGSVKRIFVFFGGSDPSNETTKALKAMQLLDRPDIAVDVVTGAASPYQEEIRALCSLMPNVTYHCQVDNMAELMAAADLAIGAGGTVTWERCFLGLPTLIITIADNQVETSEHLSDFGGVWFIGKGLTVTAELLAERVHRVLLEPVAVARTSVICKTIVDNLGCKRVSEFLNENRTLEYCR